MRYLPLVWAGLWRKSARMILTALWRTSKLLATYFD
jgi:hypothetical protein